MVTREEFKYLAAGKCVYGKESIDRKHLEIFIEGALYAYDYLKTQNKPQQGLIKNETQPAQLTTNKSSVLEAESSN